MGDNAVWSNPQWLTGAMSDRQMPGGSIRQLYPDVFDTKNCLNPLSLENAKEGRSSSDE
jgi:hypothetical protein